MMACFVYIFCISWIFFKRYHKFFGLRVSAKTELAGLDIPEMGSLGYNPDWDLADIPELAGVEGVALAGTD